MGRPVSPRRIWLAGAIVPALLATACCGVRFPKQHVFPPGQPPPSPAEVLNVWLTKNCKFGEHNDLEKYMRRYKEELTPKLISAFESVPDPDYRKRIVEYATRQWVDVQSRLETIRLRPDDRARLRNVYPRDYAARVERELILAHKSAALAGLGVVRTPEAVLRLQQEAANPKSEFRTTAGVILGRIKKPLTPPKPAQQSP